jgi:hypothetical protein
MRQMPQHNAAPNARMSLIGGAMLRIGGSVVHQLGHARQLVAVVCWGVALGTAACKKNEEENKTAAGPPKSATAIGSDSGVSATSVSCASGATCYSVDARGNRTDNGTFTAQCTGTYPDFVDLVPANYSGARFKLAQDFPQSMPAHVTDPWLQHDFTKPAGADAYMKAVFDYVADGMAAVDWRAENNTKRRWYHVPWMTAGAHPREFLRGMTEERPVSGPELGLKKNVTIQNWAVGFYNDVGGFALGQIWKTEPPDLTKADFPDGTVVAKILFSDVTAADFEDGVDLLAGAPEVDVNLKVRGTKAQKKIQKMRLMQMDVAIRDSRATETGWVFGTFAYDKDAGGTDPWQRMKPVGLMWGNDPTITQTQKPKQSLISTLAPAYAKTHVGFGGRLNGPVDNPVSSCLSCHSTAQSPNQAPMTWTSSAFKGACDTYKERMQWFRNLKPDDLFGEIESSDCSLKAGTSFPEKPGFESFDYSLQLAVAALAQADAKNANSCAAQMVAVKNGPTSILTDRTETFSPTAAAQTTSAEGSGVGPVSGDSEKSVPKNRYPIER